MSIDNCEATANDGTEWKHIPLTQWLGTLLSGTPVISVPVDALQDI
jgi:hypothetical protein